MSTTISGYAGTGASFPTPPPVQNPAESASTQPAVAQGNTEAANAAGKSVNVLVAAKQQLNVNILQASAQVSLSAGNESQSLLFKSAIEHINSLLAPELGLDAIQNAAKNQDNSPEATAGRIVSLSTAWLSSYAKQHPNEDAEKVAQDFVALIRKGFEQGYGEAKDILQGLKVFDGEVKSGVEKTFELVQKGYDDFLAQTLEALKPQQDPASTAAT
ncbi:MAG: DUF5610 domain-containing protein [Zoogloeaceae bacterium]|nr:DUF5610 domain-containing protein [Zoogloeaceae bacterium]